jgi:hypothetical protein
LTSSQWLLNILITTFSNLDLNYVKKLVNIADEIKNMDEENVFSAAKLKEKYEKMFRFTFLTDLKNLLFFSNVFLGSIVSVITSEKL